MGTIREFWRGNNYGEGGLHDDSSVCVRVCVLSGRLRRRAGRKEAICSLGWKIWVPWLVLGCCRCCGSGGSSTKGTAPSSPVGVVVVVPAPYRWPSLGLCPLYSAYLTTAPAAATPATGSQVGEGEFGLGNGRSGLGLGRLQ